MAQVYVIYDLSVTYLAVLMKRTQLTNPSQEHCASLCAMMCFRVLDLFACTKDLNFLTQFPVFITTESTSSGLVKMCILTLTTTTTPI